MTLSLLFQKSPYQDESFCDKFHIIFFSMRFRVRLVQSGSDFSGRIICSICNITAIFSAVKAVSEDIFHGRESRWNGVRIFAEKHFAEPSAESLRPYAAPKRKSRGFDRSDFHGCIVRSF